MKSFTHVLRDSIRLYDQEWRFAVPELPRPQELDSRQLVKTISLVTKGQTQEILLKLEPLNLNRAISGEPLWRFVLISFAGFRPLPRQPPDSSGGDALQPTTPRECSEYAVRLLRAGVWLEGVHYNFYGYSNS